MFADWFMIKIPTLNCTLAGEEVDLSIPFYVMGGVSFVGVYVTLLLPDTSKTMLPNTLEESLALENKK